MLFWNYGGSGSLSFSFFSAAVHVYARLRSLKAGSHTVRHGKLPVFFSLHFSPERVGKNLGGGATGSLCFSREAAENALLLRVNASENVSLGRRKTCTARHVFHATTTTSENTLIERYTSCSSSNAPRIPNDTVYSRPGAYYYLIFDLATRVVSGVQSKITGIPGARMGMRKT